MQEKVARKSRNACCDDTFHMIIAAARKLKPCDLTEVSVHPQEGRINTLYPFRFYFHLSLSPPEHSQHNFIHSMFK